MTYPKVTTGAQTPGVESSAVPSSPVPASVSFPEIEARVRSYWDDDGTFVASVENREAGENGKNEFVFYDGPPFANGLPHYGHLLTGYVKDIVPRYQTMRGRRVERRFGWDCHGLPAEVEAEKQLGITHKSEIEAMGVAEFNDACRTSVLRYTSEWEDYVGRQARWVDFANDYKTLDTDYMESVMWAFKTLWDKGLVYEGFRVLAYCWRCETPLSNTETRMDDVYRQRQDPASTVWLELETGERALAWTTMPWTLVPNSNLVVGADIDYAVMEHPDGHRYLLAEARLAEYERELDGARQVETLKGRELVGRRYTPVFEFLVESLADAPNAFTILEGDFVSTDEGTGIVQVAPSHGEDDFNVCTAAGVPVVMTVDSRGEFMPIAPRFEGLQVFEANKPLLRELRDRGMLFRQDSYDHPYPHCWRCDNPLIYRAVSSWFVKVTEIKDRMVELNQQIEWVPAHIRDGSFGKWLSNARDWSISRNRFWGSPIPVWTSDDPDHPRLDVYGSLDEIERDFGVRPADLHRPYVDELTRPNPDDPTGRSTMRRVPEVLDCWFESGSMPFAQVHYPFENQMWFEHHYPGDFIVEYIPQTRGWFYTLHVLATALFDRPAFRTCIAHGLVLGHDGRKMSKSLRNYPDVSEVFDRDGSDAMRWFLMSSPILRGGNLVVTEEGIRDGVRQVVLPLWNAWSFFALYANASNSGEGYEAKRYEPADHPDGEVMDRYLMARLGGLVTSVQEQMDALDVAAACQSVRDFVDVLTNWYIRRTRSRFWREDADALDALWTTLVTLCQVAAPLLPLVTEEVWRGLTGGRSVHLTDWPDAGTLVDAPDLVRRMETTRSVASVALSLRKAAGLRVRLPLASLTVVAPGAAELERDYAPIIAEELNVQQVRLVELTDAGAQDFGVTQRLTVNARTAGPRLGAEVQKAIQGGRSGDWTADGGRVVCAGIPLEDGEFTLETVVDPDKVGGGNEVEVLPGGGFVVLDTVVTPELAAIGLARDVVRVVQQARRDAGLAVGDRIRLTVAGEQEVWEAVVEHQHLVVSETLADSFGSTGDLGALPLGEGVVDATVGDGFAARVKVERL
ncbi:MAG TPA: isoleucine--tRNA ligase [Actinomycetales bacterium]|nr:isoleucine--tRNA ligase [Actinomycetales bacterium]